MPHLLELKDVSVSFGKKEVTHGVSLTLDEGEVLGIVGESGSGKSVSMHAVTRLLAQGGRARGKVLFNTKNGEMIDLLSISDKEMRVHRGTEIGIIFQEPMTSLNPVLTIGNQLSEIPSTFALINAIPKSIAERTFDLPKLFNATSAVILSKTILTFDRFLNPSITTA